MARRLVLRVWVCPEASRAVGTEILDAVALSSVTVAEVPGLR
jgi:hypothetical protein